MRRDCWLELSSVRAIGEMRFNVFPADQHRSRGTLIFADLFCVNSGNVGDWSSVLKGWHVSSLRLCMNWSESYGSSVTFAFVTYITQLNSHRLERFCGGGFQSTDNDWDRYECRRHGAFVGWCRYAVNNDCVSKKKCRQLKCRRRYYASEYISTIV